MIAPCLRLFSSAREASSSPASCSPTSSASTTCPPLRIVLHDIDAERLEVARGTAEQVAARFGRTAEIVATLDRREALAGADFVINMIQVGGIDATRVDLEVPAAAGLRQTIGDTTGVGGVFRGAAHVPGALAASPPTCSSSAPTRWFLNYTNPMAMNVWWMSVVAPQHQDRRPLPQRLLDRARPVRADRRADGGHALPRGRREPPGVAGRVVPRRRGPLPAPARGDRARPRARAPRARRDLQPHRLLPDRDQRALLRVPVVVPALRRADREVPPAAAGVPRHLRGERRRVRARARPRSPPASRSSSRRAPPSTRRRSSTRSSPAPSARSTRTSSTAGCIDNLPEGAVVEVPARVDADGRASRCRSARSRAQGAALNRTYLSVAELDHRGGAHRRPRAGAPGRARRPERQLHAHAGADLGPLRRAHRRATPTCCRVALGGTAWTSTLTPLRRRPLTPDARRRSAQARATRRALSR